MEKFEDIYDDKKIREYNNNIRKSIYNMLNDFRYREGNARFNEILFVREIDLFSNIRDNIKIKTIYTDISEEGERLNNFIKIKKICPNISEEEEERLNNLIKIYACLKNITFNISSNKKEFDCINSLVNED